jgi:gas vesicle protein
MYDHSRQKDFVCGALVGGTVAVMASLLFTTKKGRQIQRKIAEAYDDIEEKISDQFSDAKNKVEEGADHLYKKTVPKNKQDDNPKDSK